MAPFLDLPCASRVGLILALVVCAASASAQPQRSAPLTKPGASPTEAAGLTAAIRATVEEAALTPSDGAPGDGFGFALALSGDRALVGASGSGSAYVFVRSGSSWTQEATLTADDTADGDGFGSAVSLSGDRALVGAGGHDSADRDAGAAYVFVRSGTSWALEATLTASDGYLSDYFGGSVSLSGDRALVGASSNFGISSGAAYVFVRSGSTWTEEAILAASDAAVGDGFGSDVSLEGDRALVGANTAESFRGSAYVFARSDTEWTQEARLVASDAAADDEFGGSVSLSGDRVLIGAQFKSGTVAFSGAAYVFARSGTAWTEETKLTSDPEVERAFFGGSVALVGDRALAGASGEASFRGSAYVFVRSGEAWTQGVTLVASEAAANDFFGNAVALSSDRAVVGIDAPSAEIGAAYVFADLGPVAAEPGLSPARALAGPMPNPTAGRTSFVLTLDTPRPVRASLFDRLGREVGVLFDGMAVGETRFDADTAALPPGVYIVRVTGAGFAEARQMTVVR